MAETRILLDPKELDVMLNRAIVAGVFLQQKHNWIEGLSPLPGDWKAARDEVRKDILREHKLGVSA